MADSITIPLSISFSWLSAYTWMHFIIKGKTKTLMWKDELMDVIYNIGKLSIYTTLLLFLSGKPPKMRLRKCSVTIIGSLRTITGYFKV